MIPASSLTPSSRFAEVLPTGVEPTGVEPTGVEPTGTSASVSGGNAIPLLEKPTGLSSIGVEPTGVEPTGVVKNDGVAGALIVRSRSASSGTLRNAEILVPVGSGFPCESVSFTL